jgi:hypothetical protein
MLKNIDWDRGFFRLWLAYLVLVIAFCVMWIAGHPDLSLMGQKALAEGELLAKPVFPRFLESLIIFVVMVAIYSLPPLVIYKAGQWIVSGFKKSQP